MKYSIFAYISHFIFSLFYPFVLSFFASKKYRRMTVLNKFIFYHPSIHSTSLKLRRVLRTNGKGNSIKRDCKKVCFLFLIFLCILALPIYSLQYDKAADLLKQSKWDEAYEMLVPLITHNPDQADLLYDTGIAAYNKDKYEQALAYFARAAEHAEANSLKINAYFNAGNACIPLKQLPRAITYYDKVLELDSQNEYALHNKKCVEEMLKQQSQKDNQQNQQDQQDKQDQKNQDQKQDQDKQQDQNSGNDQRNNDQQDQQNNQQNDQRNQQQNNNQQSNKNDSQNGDSKDQQDRSDSSQKDSDNEQGSNGSDGSDGETGKNQRDKQNKPKDTNNHQERNSDQKSHNTSDEVKDKKEGQQGQDHNKAPQEKEQKSDKDMSNVASEEHKDQADKKEQGGANASSTGQGQEEMKQALQQQLKDPWLVNILEKQEERDKVANKQLMSAKICQSGGKNEQNSW